MVYKHQGLAVRILKCQKVTKLITENHSLYFHNSYMVGEKIRNFEDGILLLLVVHASENFGCRSVFVSKFKLNPSK